MVLPATSSKSKMYWRVSAITRAIVVVLHVLVTGNDDARLERGHLVQRGKPFSPLLILVRFHESWVYSVVRPIADSDQFK